MENINKKLRIRKSIFLGILTFILIGFWFISALLFNNKLSFSVILHKEAQVAVKQITSEKLHKGDKIKGEFRAKENYLGLILLKFDNYVKQDYNSEDTLIFKIRQKGDSDWYFTNKYKSGILVDNSLFPFGFPVINESKDKIYVFEVESLSGNDKNSVGINKDNPILITGYQFPRNEIFSSNNTTSNYLIKKTIYSFTNTDFLLSSVVFLLPLIIFFLIYVMTYYWKRIKHIGQVTLGILIVFILSDIFIIKDVYLGILMSLILGWIYILVKLKISSKINFIIALILILFWALLILFNINEFQNKINIWVYTFLAIGIGHAVFEEKK